MCIRDRLTFLRLIVHHARTLASTNTYSRMLTQFLWRTRKPTFRKLDRSDWLEYSSKVNSAHLKCELCLLSQQIGLFRSRRRRRHTPRAFCLKTGFFAFQFAVNARVQREEGRKKSDEEEGKKQREQLNSHSHGADCCLRSAWPSGITMLVTDTSSTTGVRFLPSFVGSLLPVILLSFLTVLRSRLPHLLPSYLFTFSLSLVPSDKVH